MVCKSTWQNPVGGRIPAGRRIFSFSFKFYNTHSEKGLPLGAVLFIFQLSPAAARWDGVKSNELQRYVPGGIIAEIVLFTAAYPPDGNGQGFKGGDFCKAKILPVP